LSAGSVTTFPPLALAVDGQIVHRGERVILSKVTFRLESGHALILTGANGAGKTTLLRTIAGFLQPSSGRIRFAAPGEGGSGEAVVAGNDSEPESSIAQRSHVVGHLDGLKAALTVNENLSFWATYLEPGLTDKPEAIATALAQFDLAALADVPAGYLSAGQKRRLGLARLAVAQRPLWLLDEPSVSLDRASVTSLRAAIASHLSRGGLVLAATHVDLGLPQAVELRLGQHQIPAETGAV
jgi:heme exporter protein A